ncbi:ABC transporter related [Chlorobaculum parvum NCIB 8327]|uniref:ABC transporter related n=1 Tax=Chlorobaculum parvum (strain DSM 263 / NCIMB 8327) TaxID=517417 RepID=B3QNP1_CHLP8|nr:ABC transporter ATP-binding protein [Chlorobaculum parvum]ACF11544.1 ABC transporter related [Chlorobaculum parvum NCIB 8327]
MATAVKLSGITKQFGNLKANDGVSLSIEAGTIHALVGENGAGKSTLSNIIYGLLHPDSGTIEIDGKKRSFSSTREAIDTGIGMVHQHFMLVPTLTAAENIMLGKEGSRFMLPSKRLGDEIEKLGKQHGLDIEPNALVSSLSVGQQQRVEILKLLYRKSNILILDEPTAVLSPPETERLFATLRSLVAEGKTILLITHKLDEVLAISDAVSVMRKGKLVGTVQTAETSKEELARMMVGRDVLLRTDNPEQTPEATVLSIDKLRYVSPQGIEKLRGLSLTVHAGEIYGIAGVEGNGQSELLSLLWGTFDRDGRTEGAIRIGGQSALGLSPTEIAGLGVSMIPEDRLKSAVVAEYGIAENLILGRHREPAFHRGIGFDSETLRKNAATMIERYDIRSSAPGANPPVASLSGGNQQKVVVAREMERPGLKLLVLAQPTRGVDIGAIEQIHKRIIDARQKGLAILLISSELEELIALSTRIGCLYKGVIRHEFTEAEVRQGREHESGFEKEIGLHIT